MNTSNRITLVDTQIHISTKAGFQNKAEESTMVIPFDTAIPVLQIFQDETLFKTFTIEPLTQNSDLNGQYFHISVRVLENEGVMIDGIISKNAVTFPEQGDDGFEGIRIQPFFLSSSDSSLAQEMVGKGLFERGLHFGGRITPTTIRCIALCDSCNTSFTIQHFHAGFSDSQYFYSSKSKQTLIVRQDELQDMPSQLDSNIDEQRIVKMEKNLPKPSSGDGVYAYYNSFCCPHCSAPYIDFEKNKNSRPGEYYGLKHINDIFYTIKNP